MKPTYRVIAALASAAVLIASSSTASAQVKEGFALDRFEPADRGSDWFSLDSLDFRGHNRLAIGDTTELAYKPLVIYEPDGAERAAVVKLQGFTHVGASLVLWDRVRAGFNLPVLFWQTATHSHIGATKYEANTNATIGDIRVSADVRLLGKYETPFTMTAGLAVFAPTGDRGTYTGDGKPRVYPRLMAAGNISDFAYAARLSYNYHAQKERFVPDTQMGDEIGFGVSAGLVAMRKRFLFGPELYGTTGVHGAFTKERTPFEVLIGIHYRITTSIDFGVAMGPGISRGFGTPLVRWAASLEWHPAYEPPAPPPPPDRDHDAIADAVDACPDAAGIWTNHPSTNGCPPPPPDRDHDGVVDDEDACIDVAGVATQEPKTNGCPPPPPDRDLDGVLDPEDACPEEAGVATQDPKTNGCKPPPPDRDGDSVLDNEDACPDHAGPRDTDVKKNGCPTARVEGGQIRIMDQVKFATGSAKLLPDSDGVLNAVLDILQKHTEIQKIRVEGHTDNKGNAGVNLFLSKDRAASVAAWLVKHGIDKKRIESAGFGQKNPVDTNDTEAGRANNRRVEFHIVGDAAKEKDKAEKTRGGEVGGPEQGFDKGAPKPSEPPIPTTQPPGAQGVTGPSASPTPEPSPGARPAAGPNVMVKQPAVKPLPVQPKK
jgi:OmpA-OmpF porin, OOP family